MLTPYEGQISAGIKREELPGRRQLLSRAKGSYLRLAQNTRGRERGDPPGIGGFNYNGPKVAKSKCHKWQITNRQYDYNRLAFVVKFAGLLIHLVG